jgi:hypothetical protein
MIQELKRIVEHYTDFYTQMPAKFIGLPCMYIYPKGDQYTLKFGESFGGVCCFIYNNKHQGLMEYNNFRHIYNKYAPCNKMSLLDLVCDYLIIADTTNILACVCYSTTDTIKKIERDLKQAYLLGEIEAINNGERLANFTEAYLKS